MATKWQYIQVRINPLVDPKLKEALASKAKKGGWSLNDLAVSALRYAQALPLTATAIANGAAKGTAKRRTPKEKA
jgi:hypothetical protein